MKKLIILLAIPFVVLSTILPVTALLVKKGFAQPQESWAPKAVYFGARLRMKIARYETARRILAKALTTWPTYDRVDDATYWVGFCYEKTDRDAEAMTWYRNFLQKWPRHRWAEQARRRLELLEAQNL
jgi:TolA-binding protein